MVPGTRNGDEDLFESPIDDYEALLNLKNEAMNPFGQPSKKESTDRILLKVSIQENLRRI